MSHSRRAYINTQRNKEEALNFFGHGSSHPPYIVIKVPHDLGRGGNKPQTMMIWPGLQLLGAGHKCLKGLFYEVASVDAAFFRLVSGQKLTRGCSTEPGALLCHYLCKLPGPHASRCGAIGDGQPQLHNETPLCGNIPGYFCSAGGGCLSSPRILGVVLKQSCWDRTTPPK